MSEKLLPVGRGSQGSTRLVVIGRTSIGEVALDDPGKPDRQVGTVFFIGTEQDGAPLSMVRAQQKGKPGSADERTTFVVQPLHSDMPAHYEVQPPVTHPDAIETLAIGFAAESIEPHVVVADAIQRIDRG